MRADQKGGVIINMGSIASVRSSATNGTKSALLARPFLIPAIITMPFF
jgi:hypothetical protein